MVRRKREGKSLSRISMKLLHAFADGKYPHALPVRISLRRRYVHPWFFNLHFLVIPLSCCPDIASRGCNSGRLTSSSSFLWLSSWQASSSLPSSWQASSLLPSSWSSCHTFRKTFGFSSCCVFHGFPASFCARIFGASPRLRCSESE
jgi:hypothetical protein